MALSTYVKGRAYEWSHAIGRAAANGTGFNYPQTMCLDGNGGVYVANRGNENNFGMRVNHIKVGGPNFEFESTVYEVPAFYTQAVSADGFPIVASAKVNPYALKEAAFLVSLMLEKRPDHRPQTVEAVLVISADAISASRPGARGESLEHYIKRLTSLEEIATAKQGVAKAYALQAGREIRVIVEPTEVDDDAAALLSHEIARQIEDQLEYPGQVKVIVIRESRAIEIAH